MRRFFNGLWLVMLVHLYGFSPAVHAQQRDALDELLYPGARREQWVYSPEHKVHLLFVKAPVEQVLLHYLDLSQHTGWRLLFPSELEAQAWLTGLEKSKEPPVFMLNLYHLKTKINYVLTLGPVSGTSQSAAQSIITIYSTRRSFTERQGG